MRRFFLNGSVSFLVPAVMFHALAQTTCTAIISTGDAACGTYVYVGLSSNGTATVDGGDDQATNFAEIDLESGANGVMNIAGSGSTWTADGMRLGNSGSGTLQVSNGAFVASYGCDYTGFSVGGKGTATADGVGSKWNAYSPCLGDASSADGMLKISNGASISTVYGSIAEASGSTAAVTFDGVGSSWTISNALYVGDYGSGTLKITNGGCVSVAGTTCVSISSSGSTSFGTNGGTLTTRSLYRSFAQLSGTGTVKTNGMVCDGSLVLDAGTGLYRTFVVNGTNQKITVNLDMNGGSYSPIMAGTFGSSGQWNTSGYAITGVPEPQAIALMFAGLLGLFTYVRRKRR